MKDWPISKKEFFSCLLKGENMQIMKCTRCPYISMKYIFEKKTKKSYRREKYKFCKNVQIKSIAYIGIFKDYNAVIWNYLGKALFIDISAWSFLCFPGFQRPWTVYVHTHISSCLLHISIWVTKNSEKSAQSSMSHFWAQKWALL